MRDLARLEPLDVFDPAALVADEMMVAFDAGLKAGGISAQIHFADQTGPHQRMQAVVNRGA